MNIIVLLNMPVLKGLLVGVSKPVIRGAAKTKHVVT